MDPGLGPGLLAQGMPLEADWASLALTGKGYRSVLSRGTTLERQLPLRTSFLLSDWRVITRDRCRDCNKYARSLNTSPVFPGHRPGKVAESFPFDRYRVGRCSL